MIFFDSPGSINWANLVSHTDNKAKQFRSYRESGFRLWLDDAVSFGQHNSIKPYQINYMYMSCMRLSWPSTQSDAETSFQEFKNIMFSVIKCQIIVCKW